MDVDVHGPRFKSESICGCMWLRAKKLQSQRTYCKLQSLLSSSLSNSFSHVPTPDCVSKRVRGKKHVILVPQFGQVFEVFG